MSVPWSARLGRPVPIHSKSVSVDFPSPTTSDSAAPSARATTESVPRLRLTRRDATPAAGLAKRDGPELLTLRSVKHLLRFVGRVHRPPRVRSMSPSPPINAKIASPRAMRCARSDSRPGRASARRRLRVARMRSRVPASYHPVKVAPAAEASASRSCGGPAPRSAHGPRTRSVHRPGERRGDDSAAAARLRRRLTVRPLGPAGVTPRAFMQSISSKLSSQRRASSGPSSGHVVALGARRSDNSEAQDRPPSQAPYPAQATASSVSPPRG